MSLHSITFTAQRVSSGAVVMSAACKCRLFKIVQAVSKPAGREELQQDIVNHLVASGQLVDPRAVTRAVDHASPEPLPVVADPLVPTLRTRAPARPGDRPPRKPKPDPKVDLEMVKRLLGELELIWGAAVAVATRRLGNAKRAQTVICRTDDYHVRGFVGECQTAAIYLSMQVPEVTANTVWGYLLRFSTNWHYHAIRGKVSRARKLIEANDPEFRALVSEIQAEMAASSE